MYDISVVIPLREEDSVSEWTMDSLRKQTYDSFEVILYKSAGNAAENRNLGARKAQGAYFLFLDADIELDPEFLFKLKAHLETNSACFAYCSYDRVGELTGVERGVPWDRTLLRERNYISTMSLIKRTCFIGFNERLERLQDWEMWLAMADRGCSGTFLDEILFTAHYKPGDISTDPSNWNASVLAVRDQIRRGRH